MKRQSISPQDYNDCCPVHAAAQTREYTFGMGDATVVKHRCGCCIVFDDSGLNDGVIHPNYESACGQARLIVALSASDDRAFA